MSSVRMCDKCGQIFSENEEDWSTFSGSRRRRREDGSRFTESIDQDACPKCTNGGHPVTPRLAIPAGADPELYTKWLEEQAGVVQGNVIAPGGGGGGAWSGGTVTGGSGG